MIRLLSFPVADCETPSVSARLFDDLQLSPMFEAKLSRPARYLTANTAALRERNLIFEDILDKDSLFEAFTKLRDAITGLQYVVRTPDNDALRILGSLTSYRELYEAGERLLSLFELYKLRFDYGGFAAALRGFLKKSYCPDFRGEWDSRAGDIEKISSVTYNIYFDEALGIRQVALNGVAGDSYKKPRFILSAPDPTKLETRSLAALTADDRFGGRKRYDPAHDDEEMARVSHGANCLLPMVTTEARQSVYAPLGAIAAELGTLKTELDFLLGLAELIRELRGKGLGFSFAEVCPREARRFTAEGLYHPPLALLDRAAIKANDAELSGSLALLGGQNRGGKTVFLRSIGAVQVFFQLGLPVPARSAALSPADRLVCVFTREESDSLAQGKIGRELYDVREAAEAAGDYTLALFNEPITATSPLECRLLSREVLCILRLKAVRGVWVTHIYPLFDDAEDMNAALPGSVFVPMHANPPNSELDRFSILPGRPESDSGARFILKL